MTGKSWLVSYDMDKSHGHQDTRQAGEGIIPVGHVLAVMTGHVPAIDCTSVLRQMAGTAFE